MGVLLGIERGLEIFETTLELYEKLKQHFPSRTVVIQVYNHTDRTLRLQAHEHSSGMFGELPSQRIPPGTVDIYGSRRRGRPEGSTGSVRYHIEGTAVLCTVRWSLRWRSWRSRSSGSNLSGSGSLEFEVTDLMGGSTSEGQARFELLPRVNDPIIVESGSGSAGGIRPSPGVPGPVGPGAGKVLQ